MATEQSVMAVIRASRPTFRNPHDKVAFVVHAAFLSSGYILNLTGPAACADDALASASSSDEVGIDNWNEFDENYAFVYSKPGSKKVLVRGLVMNGKLCIDALKEGHSEPVHLEVNSEDYVAEDAGSNYSSQFKNLSKLVELIDKQVLSKLAESSKVASTDQPSSSESSRIRDNVQPARGFSDPDDQPPLSHPSGVVVPPVPPFGGNDLFPGGGAGIYPTRGDFGPGGGMLIGPHDPRFFGGIGEPGLPRGQPGIPPGARFDPYGPPGVPGFEPGRFVRDPRRPGSGTHPDLEHFHGDSDFI